MKHKVCELEGALLDAAVAKLEGWRPMAWYGRDQTPVDPPRYSADWQYGGPIIEREQMTLQPSALADGETGWEASTGALGSWSETGPTLLIAAMRAYVFSKFGDEVDPPSSTAPAAEACR